MRFEPGCKYCENSVELEALMLPVAALRVSSLFLFKDQAHRGRCIVALNEHRRELFDLDPDVLSDYAADVAQAARAVSRAFGPGKVNYGIFGDKAPHLHVHIVPKYEGGRNWGEAFQLAPTDPVSLSDAEYRSLVEAIRAVL